MPCLTARNEGASRFSVTHSASGIGILTDAPAGHGGDGVSFSPIDLCVAALLNCTGTLMAVKAKALGLDTTGMTMSADYTMADAPRRIVATTMTANVPFAADERQRQSIIRAAATCPVRNSLMAEWKITLVLNWADGTSQTVED